MSEWLNIERRFSAVRLAYAVCKVVGVVNQCLIWLKAHPQEETHVQHCLDKQEAEA